MIQQADTIAQNATATTSGMQTARQVHQLTPRQVLSWLPKSATPQQMDSAIQLHIKPSEIRWSTMPDTLHLPGHSRGKSFRDVSLPQYYKESFFSKDSLFHPELTGGRLGVAGDPVPYTIAGDNFFTSLLLGCFILAMVACSQSRRFISRQAKNFFFVSHDNFTTITETSNELRFQIFLVLQTCLLLAFGFFFYTRAFVGDTFVLEPYEIIGIYSGIIAVYFAFKFLAYWFTNWVFFDKKRNEQWLKSLLFIISMEGVAIFPIVLLQTYFNLSMRGAIVYAAIIIVFVKILTFYKTYIIFFRQKGSFLQNILYFCGLEIVPLLTTWGILVTVNSYLEINF
jgi:hypothetical protein